MKKIKILILLIFIISFCVGCELPGTLEAKVSFNPTGNQSMTVGDTITLEATFDKDIKSYIIIPYKNNKSLYGPYMCNQVDGTKKLPIYAQKLGDEYYYEFVMYSDSGCTEEEQKFKTPTYTVDKNRVIVDTRCEKSEDWGTYCKTTDKSNGGYKQIGQQGWYTDYCLCYSVGYGKRMINNTIITTKKSDCFSYVEKKSPASSEDLFDALRNEILKNNKPVVVRVQNSESDGQHYILINGILKDSVKKAKSKLSYSDFWVVDPVGDAKYATTSSPPTEDNWQDLIDSKDARAGYNRKLKGLQYCLIK